MSTTVPVMFLIVSIVSLTAQSVAAVRIATAPRLPGLVRTSVCRVAVAALYVALGIVALHTSPATAGRIALSVFSVTGVVWICNSVLDARLAQHSAKVGG